MNKMKTVLLMTITGAALAVVLQLTEEQSQKFRAEIIKLVLFRGGSEAEGEENFHLADVDCTESTRSCKFEDKNGNVPAQQHRNVTGNNFEILWNALKDVSVKPRAGRIQVKKVFCSTKFKGNKALPVHCKIDL